MLSPGPESWRVATTMKMKEIDACQIPYKNFAIIFLSAMISKVS
jgi:hypothetical protein